MRAALVLRGLAVALVATLLVAALPGASGERAGSILRTTLRGQPVRLTMPTGDGKPRGLVIYFHGQGGNVNDRIDGPFMGALRRDGWAIASSDFHGEAWGNAASTADTEALIEWAEGQSGVPATLWVSGSMGGTTSLNAILHGVEPPPCWYGVKPAISLADMHRVPAADRYIAQAYGGEVPADRNPVRNIGRLPDDVRYRVVASPEDELVDLRLNGGALVYRLDQRGIDVTYLASHGKHEDPSNFNGDDLVMFANACLEGATLDAGTDAVQVGDS